MFHSPKRLTRALSAIAIVVGAGAGAAGIAAAASGGSSSSPAQQVVPPPAGQDQGNVDFTPAGEKTETPDKAAEKTETADKAGEAKKAPETESAKDPEPGHEDPNGANVDHTPAGEAPEPAAPNAQG
jgi:hypothetical protein